MRKILSKIRLLFFAFLCSIPFLKSQTKDSISIVKNSFYVRTMPIAVYAGAGFMKDRITQNIEVGKSYGVMDIGVALGRTSLRPDTTTSLQLRVTMDACQYGIFSNELAIGGGYIFNSSTPLMLELSSTIFAQVGKNWGVGLIGGFTDLSGDYNDSFRNFWGVFFRYGLLRNETGVLIGTHKAHAHHGR